MTTMTHETITVGQISTRFLLEGQESGGAVSMFEFDVPAGARVPIPHSHDGYEETIYGLEGTLTWTVDGMHHRGRPRRRHLHPPRRRPRLRERGDADATALAIVTPGHPRPRVLPGSGGDRGRGSGRPTRPRGDGGGHAQPRADARPVSVGSGRVPQPASASRTVMSSPIRVRSSTSRAMLSGGATTSSFDAFAVELVREPLQQAAGPGCRCTRSPRGRRRRAARLSAPGGSARGAPRRSRGRSRR